MNCFRRKTWASLAGAVIVMVSVSACSTAVSTPAVEHKSDSSAELSVKVQLLQRQLRERDKRIEELESQLDILKLIEQDFTRQRAPLHPPAILTPVR